MPRILLALLGMAFCAVASAATVEKLTIDGKAVTVKVPEKAPPVSLGFGSASSAAT